MGITACFSNPSTSSTQKDPPNSLITCTYQAQFFNSPFLLTLTWSKTLSSHTLTVHAPELFSLTVSLSPSPFSLFRTRPGSKSVSLAHTYNPDSFKKLKLYWDFTRAEFARPNSAEPDSCFYLALICDGHVEFFLGDRRSEFARRCPSFGAIRDSTELNLVSRREHVFGRRSYSTTAQFLNSKHEVEIDCSGGAMKVKIDGETGLVVKRLGWKFRGNERILVGGLEVDFFWDVFNWVSSNGDFNGKRRSNGGHGVFVFQVGEGGGVWPEMVGPEKKLMRKSLPASPAAGGVVSPAPSWSSSVLQWAEESSDCGRSSCSNSSRSGGGGRFSLVLYAWRR